VIFRETFLKVTGYSDEIEQSSESLWDVFTLIIFLVVWFSFEIVNWMLQIEVCERSLDVVKISLVSERQMVDLVSEIELISFSSKHHDDIAVSVSINMEISGDSIILEESLEVASLLLVKFFLNTFFDGTTPVILFIHLFSAKNLT